MKTFQDFFDFFEASFCVRLKERDLGNFGESLFFSGFLFHASNISQNCKKARDFFIFIFGHSAKLAWYLNDVCYKSLSFKGLRRAAGRARASR